MSLHELRHLSVVCDTCNATLDEDYEVAWCFSTIDQARDSACERNWVLAEDGAAMCDSCIAQERCESRGAHEWEGWLDISAGRRARWARWCRDCRFRETTPAAEQRPDTTKQEA